MNNLKICGMACGLMMMVPGLGVVRAVPEGVAGPLVGNVTDQAAEVWMYAPKGAKVTVRFHAEGGEERETAFVPHEPPAAEGAGRPMEANLGGLSADTSYEYAVSVDGAKEDEWKGSFKTAPADGSGSRFRVAVTSCMRFDQPQGSWNHLLAEKPDLHLTLGDTQYSDTTEPKVQWEHHLRYRRMAEYAEVLRKVPTYSMWDDHDYGPNDSDGTAEGKENSLLGWRQFWVNPGAGTPEVPGAFYKFRRGGVEFFVVDGRYHRSPDKAPDDGKKRMLGDAQFEWLLEGLKSSTATFKVIASGSTLHHSKGDGWRVFTFSRHRLFDSLKEHGIPGVLYCSGDIHDSLVWVHPESGRVGYPLVEVISSGVANSKTLSFATIDFDTLAEDPSMRVRIVQGDGTVREEKEWKYSELGGRRGE